MDSNIELYIKRWQDLAEMSYAQVEKEYKSRIELSRALGKNGWVVSRFTDLDTSQKWLRQIESRGEYIIEKNFSQDIVDDIVEEIEGFYCKAPENAYVRRGIENYYNGRYTEAAVFLLAVFDYRICKISLGEKLRRKCEQCSKGFDAVKKSLFNTNNNRLTTKLFYTVDYIPSLSEFAIRVFVDGNEYKFESGNEPPYLNRNWLVHGRMTRRVRKYEIIQLLNALDTLIEIEKGILDNEKDET